MSHRVTALGAVVVVIVGLSACGGKSDDQKVRAVVNGFDKALLDSKFAQACDDLSATLVTEAFRTRSGCIASIATNNPNTEAGTIKSATVKGDSATVVAQGTSAGPSAIELRKQNGTWKITGPLKLFKG